MDSVDSYIEHYPDSALTVLQSIDKPQLHGAKIKARYALLLSMALDKNYIDTTDFSVLQPAIDYYAHKGSETDKLRMYYYKSVIYRNQHNEESAMAALVKGLDEGKLSNDNLTRARMLYAQGNIYYNLRNFDTYIKCMQEASHYFSKGGNRRSEINSLINVYYGYSAKNDSIKAKNQIEHLKKIALSDKKADKNRCFEAILSYEMQYSKDSLKNTLSDYLRNVEHSQIPWLSVAAAYLLTGDYDSGFDAIGLYNKYNADQNIRYHAILSELHENSGNISDALFHYKQYFLRSDSVNVSKLKSDTQFIEERYSLKLENAEKENFRKHTLSASISIILILLLVIVIIRQKLKSSILEKRLLEAEKEKLAHSYSLLEEEVLSLKDLLDSNMSLDKSITDIIMERIDLLNQLFISRIRDEKELWQKIDTIIEDREEFMHSLLLVYTSTHPKFISYLKERNLTEMEMEYCCLFAIGMNGKDIGFYTNKSRHYHISSCIREKLGIDNHATNLKNYINGLLC
ncbi:MAG: hypothetical protein IKY70_07125 [Bacteroidales bacterium]|nr:hypothetical protein [Bacteroidales bacterium]